MSKLVPIAAKPQPGDTEATSEEPPPASPSSHVARKSCKIDSTTSPRSGPSPAAERFPPPVPRRRDQSSYQSGKRQQVQRACAACRQKRMKCDAIRPSCGPCRTRNLNCSYDTEPGVTWSVSLKRKHDAMQTDLEQLQQIYEAIRTSPRVEADNMVKQIRDSSNPLEVISCTWNRSTTASNKYLGPLSDAKMRNSAERPGTAGPTTAAQACQECRDSERKCDELRPICGLCQHKVSACEYSEPPTLSTDGTIAQTLVVLPRSESETKSNHGRSSVTPSALSPGQGSSHSKTLPPPHLRLDNVRKDDHCFDKCSQRNSQTHVSVSHRVLLWPEIFRHISETGTADAVSDLHFVLDLGTPWLSKREVWERVPDLSYKHGLESLDLGNGSCIFPDLTIQLVKEYTAAYFKTFNVLLPLLDPDIFMDTVVSRLLHDGYSEGDPESVLALLVFALGKLAMVSASQRPNSANHRGSNGFPSHTIERPPGLGLFNEARRRMGMVGTKCLLENVQINLLQATYFESCARHSDFWSSVSAASMACMYLIEGRSVDWSSSNGDLIKRAFWICVFHERLFDLDLRVASTGIESMEDRVPLPHFHRPFKQRKQSIVFRTEDGDASSVDKQNDYAYHFFASITLSRMIRRVGDLMHGHEHTLGGIEPLRQEEGSQEHLRTTKTAPCSQQYSEPPSSLIKEFVRQLESWRASLPSRLQWRDYDEPDSINAQRTARLSQESPLRLITGEANYDMDIAMAQLRIRFYHARFLVYRPFVYKALHMRELMTEDDCTNCAYAVEAACLWPIGLSMPEERKYLIPHMFSWTQNFMAIVLILRLCRKIKYLGDICKNGGVTDANIERSSGLMIEWLKEVRQVDGVADWSLRVLGPSM